MEILLATHNEHKKEEIQQILGKDYRVTSLVDYELFEEIEENGVSFHENAKIKAVYCYQKTGKPSIGDDSGLVIPALGYKPGIFSARYSGNHDFEANVAKVLREMECIEDRKAYFVTVMCLYNGSEEHYFEGRIYGIIAGERSGDRGFGYDPIFIPEGYDISFAEMKPQDKNKISHRKNAIDQLVLYLKNSE